MSHEPHITAWKDQFAAELRDTAQKLLAASDQSGLSDLATSVKDYDTGFLYRLSWSDGALYLSPLSHDGETITLDPIKLGV